MEHSNIMKGCRWCAAIAFCCIAYILFYYKSNELNAKNIFSFRKGTMGSNIKNEYYISSQKVRQEFYERYGGKDYATHMFNDAIVSFDRSSSSNILSSNMDNKVTSSVLHTAKRILYAIATSRPFTIAFGGYSVTAGRGNYFNQSYPFVLERIIQDPMKKLGVHNFTVRNGAIGGAPSFPYGWCLDNFLGSDADAVGWDYSLGQTNPSTTGSFEYYLRNALTMHKSPLFIMIDSNILLPTRYPNGFVGVVDEQLQLRMKLLQNYTDNGDLHDAIAINFTKAWNFTTLTSDFITYQKQTLANQNGTEENQLPIGFQNWDEWGAPAGSPGQAPWHPRRQWHALTGWLLAMHFVDVMDVAMSIMATSSDSWRNDITKEMEAIYRRKLTRFHKPFYPTTESSVASILHGTPRDATGAIITAQNDSEKQRTTVWAMNRISCRTTFQPLVNGSLLDLVVSGIASSSTTHDNNMTNNTSILTPPDPSLYEKGWILNIDERARRAKQAGDMIGVGYMDSKAALYGVYQSGSLRLMIPNSDPKVNGSTQQIKTFVICSWNDQKLDHCDLRNDVRFVIDGIETTDIEGIHITPVQVGTFCFRIGINDEVTAESREKIETTKSLSSMPSNNSMAHDNHTLESGVFVDITITNPNITLNNDRVCTIAHVIWED